MKSEDRKKRKVKKAICSEVSVNSPESLSFHCCMEFVTFWSFHIMPKLLTLSAMYAEHARSVKLEPTSVCLSVCLSVRSIIRPPHAAAAGLLLWARRPGDIDRLLHCRRSAANAGSVTLSADVASSTQTCYTGWAKKRGH